MVEEEDGEFGGSDGAAEEDLGRLIGLGRPQDGSRREREIDYLDEGFDLVEGKGDHMSAATGFDG